MDQEQSQPDDTNSDAVAAQATTVEVQKKKVSKKLIIVLSVVVLLVVGGCAAWWFLSAQKPQNASTQNLPQQKTVKKQAAVEPDLTHFITPTTGEKWFDTPKPIANQGYLRVEFADYFKDVDPSKLAETMKSLAPVYSEVGTRAGNTIIMAIVQSEGIGGPTPELFEKSSDGKVSYIARPGSFIQLESGEIQTRKDEFTKSVTTFDETIHYDSLSIPSKLKLENGENVERPEYTRLGSQATPAEGTTKSLVATFGQSKLYRVEKKYSDTKLTNISYELLNPLQMTVGLGYKPNTPSLEKYTWANGDKPTVTDSQGKTTYDEISAIARGCGGFTAAVTRTDELKQADLVVVGKTDSGRDVYMPKDQNATLLNKAYDEYVQYNAYDTTVKVVSKTDFIKKHGLTLIKNADGELLAYVRQALAPSYGCAKPVIYLYPTQPTNVHVKVGANVKVSEPLYPNDGWTVFAHPDGQLTYRGKTYGSLFWEGPGYGEYPGITTGTVVKRVDAAATIRQQLAQQGLNATEIKDFMEFWTDRIPNEPYIRLTWLNTAQMNTLAPLHISPKPDTSIRVFLDMAGYDAPISIAPQKLSSVARKGFTLVEWGGLSATKIAE